MVDRRLSANQITDDICISRVSVENTLHKETCMPKVSFKWAPDLQASIKNASDCPNQEKSLTLTPIQLVSLMCIVFITLNQIQRDRLCSKIIPCNQIQCRPTSFYLKGRGWPQLFWDANVFIGYLQKGRTINGDY